MTGMDKDDLLALDRRMLLIRRLEEKSAEMYVLAKIAGFLPLHIGEEAIAVGAIAALQFLKEFKQVLEYPQKLVAPAVNS